MDEFELNVFRIWTWEGADFREGVYQEVNIFRGAITYFLAYQVFSFFRNSINIFRKNWYICIHYFKLFHEMKFFDRKFYYVIWAT